MAWNYVVTAHKPTAVSLGLTGYFTHSKSDASQPLPDLVLVKGRNLYFYQCENTLKPLIEISIFGNLDCLQSYHISETRKDVLCFMTSWNLLRVVELNEDQFVTRSHCTLEVLGGQPVDHGPLMRVDQKHGLLGIVAFIGYLHIISLVEELGAQGASKASSSSSSSSNVCIRLSELIVVDFVFLQGYSAPTLALITQTVEGRQLRTYEVNISQEQVKYPTSHLTPGPISNSMIRDTEAHMLIPLCDSLQGVLVVGRSFLSYYNATGTKDSKAVSKQREAFSCYTQISPCRMILGDDRGQLFMALLRYNHEEREMTEINVEFIGETCVPTFLGYMKHALFVGSKLGDSQLLHFTEESSLAAPMETNTPEIQGLKEEQYFEVLDSLPNIGPIVDMQVVDLEKHGQGQLVTCSGCRKGGSLRIIRNGIGIESKATVDLHGIVSVWTLSLSKSIVDGSCVQMVHDTIVFTTSSSTHFLKLVGLDIEEYELDEIGDVATENQSLYISNVVHGQVVQVTTTSLRLLKAPGLLLLSEWKPPSGHGIDKVSGNVSQMLIAAKTHLYYLKILDGELEFTADRELHHEIPCLDISPTQPFGTAEVCAISLWPTVTINMLSLPNLVDISVTQISKHKCPGSIQLCWDMEGIQYLLCTTENEGSLLYYQIDPSCGALFNEKHIILGKDPVRLIQFFSHGKSNIFACSDKPTIIYSHNRKLTFSDVDQPKVTCMASLNNECYPEHLVLAHYNQLEIGKIDKIQKLHIRKIPLEETPYRIAHQEATKTLGVLSSRLALYDSYKSVLTETVRSASLRAPNRPQGPPAEIAVEKPITTMLEHGEEVDLHSLLILDQHSFDILLSYELKLQEFAVSIISCVVNSVSYYVVGTAFNYAYEEEPSSGRLLAFQVSEGRLELEHETNVDGSVYSMKFFNDMIICTINATIALYNITDAGFTTVGTHYGSVLSLMLKTKGDFVIVGDLLKSIVLLNYQKDKPKPFVEIAQDFDCKWMLALEFIDDDSFLGCENFRNLFTLIKNPDVSTEAEQSRLVQFGQFYLGESVNVLTHGSLVMETAENRPDFIQGNSIIYAGVSGSVGLVIPISEEAYNILITVQKRLTESDRVLAAANIDHSDWRKYKSQMVKKPAENFIDGDVVETLLELPRPEMTELIQDIEIKDSKVGVRTVSPEEVFRIIEELARLH